MMQGFQTEAHPDAQVFFTQSWRDSLQKGKLATNPNRSVSLKTLGVNVEKVRMRGLRCGSSVAN